MKKLITLFLITLSISFIAGCGESGTKLIAPELDDAINADGPNVPLGDPVAAPDDGSDDASVESDESSVTPGSRPGIQNSNKTSGTTTTTATTSFWTCPSSELPDADVGVAYNQVIAVTGGTGTKTYELSSGSLPDGLTFSSDGSISGTPGQITLSNFNIKATDDQGKFRNCTMKIKVQGDIQVERFPDKAKINWNEIYHLKVSDNVAGLKWIWSGDTSKVCFNKNAPTDTASSCTAGTPPGTGDEVYLWLKDSTVTDSSAKLEVKIESTNVDTPVTFNLELAYPTCGNGIVEGTEECDDGNTFDGDACDSACIAPVIPVPAQSIEVTFWTGKHDNSGTNCDVGIKFCTDPAMAICSVEQELDKDIDDREHGKVNTYDATDGLNTTGITSDYKYFEISMNGDCGNGDDSGWLLQGIKVKASYGSETPAYTYYNPCALKWIDDGDSVSFGPNDAAVCAIIETGDKSQAATDDIVWLELGNGNTSFITSDTSISSTDGPFFSSSDKNGKLAMDMSWSNYDDFQRNDITSYGDFIFDSNPFGKAPKVTIRKDADGKDSGGWFLKSYDVFIFEPGKFLNDSENSKVYRGAEIVSKWIEDEESLFESFSTDSIDSSIVSEIVDESIGGHL